MSEKEIPFIHRDVSWLSFNYRVLQEAKDTTLPLLERVKFLAIYSNNLDEFFKVRVANLRNLIRLGKKTKMHIEYDPKEVLDEVTEIVNKQQEEFSNIFLNEIIPELKVHGIYLITRDNLTEEQTEFVEQYFTDHMLPYVQPVLLIKHKIKPFLNNAALYLSVVLRDKEDKNKDNRQFAIVQIPSNYLPRFIVLPSKKDRQEVIMLDDIVRSSLKSLFPGY
ncbi:MAG: polyphosphate kinase 1, partial [Bacteroidia bacterium]|nr:polyphosphate kinase 1 [Bacteroidia bacterium]